MNAGRSLVHFLQQQARVCVHVCVCVAACVRPVVRRNPWLAMRLSRPQVIQLNAASVVMATCVLHTAALQQDKRGCLDWQITGKQREVARGTVCCLEPLIWTTTAQTGHINIQGSTWLIFINHKHRFNVISMYGGDEICSGLDLRTRKQTHAHCDYSGRCCVTDCCHLLLAPSQTQQLGARPLTGSPEAINTFVPRFEPAADWMCVSLSVLGFRFASVFSNDTEWMDKDRVCVSSFPACM